jgi:hypothetical protein
MLCLIVGDLAFCVLGAATYDIGRVFSVLVETPLPAALVGSRITALAFCP